MDEQTLKQQMKLLKRQHQEVMRMLDRHLQELEGNEDRRYATSPYPYNVLEQAVSWMLTSLERAVGWLVDKALALLNTSRRRL